MIRILMTACVVHLTATAAFADGYWRCEGDQWMAVGTPGYPEPLRTCMTEVAPLPETDTDCQVAGGTWGPFGLFPSPICLTPTPDAGRVCGDNEECEGACLTTLSPKQQAMINAGQIVRTLGTCAPVRPMFGCLTMVSEGRASPTICID